MQKYLATKNTLPLFSYISQFSRLRTSFFQGMHVYKPKKSSNYTLTDFSSACTKTKKNPMTRHFLWTRLELTLLDSFETKCVSDGPCSLWAFFFSHYENFLSIFSTFFFMAETIKSILTNLLATIWWVPEGTRGRWD